MKHNLPQNCGKQVSTATNEPAFCDMPNMLHQKVDVQFEKQVMAMVELDYSITALPQQCMAEKKNLQSRLVVKGKQSKMQCHSSDQREECNRQMICSTSVRTSTAETTKSSADSVVCHAIGHDT